MNNKKYYITYPAPIIEIKNDLEARLNTEIYIHSKNNQIAHFFSNARIEDLQEDLEEDFDVIVLTEEHLKEWL